MSIARITIRELVWDDKNREHIKKHGLTDKDVIIAMQDISKVCLKGHSDRDVILCKHDNRMLSVVLGKESENSYYVVTARDMAKKERAIYRERNNKNEQEDK